LNWQGIDIKTSDPSSLASALAHALGGVTILQKGAEDRITNGSDKEDVLINRVEGSVRRCGGQGDVLSGAVGTFLAWGYAYEQREG
jgi:ATP-dependent NAD(P)H-hydrate dehydratase